MQAFMVILLHHDSSLPRSNAVPNCRGPFIVRLSLTQSTGVRAPPNTGRRLSYHLQTHTRATACPAITGSTKRKSSSLHPVRRSAHHHRGATHIPGSHYALYWYVG